MKHTKGPWGLIIELVKALEREKGVWVYDKEYGVSNYSRIYVDQRIEAIESTIAKVVSGIS